MEPVTEPNRSRWVPLVLEKGWVPFILGSVLYLASGLELYLQTYTRIKPHHVGLAAVILAVVMGGIYIVWAALWALAGRVFQRRARFAAHLAIPLLATLALSLVSLFTEPAVFTLDLDRWSFWISLSLCTASGIWALFAHLTLVSEARPRKLLLVSLLVVGVLSGLLSAGVSLVNRHVARRSMPPFSLYPPSFMFLPGKTVEEHLSILKSLQPLVDEDARKLAAEQSSPRSST